MSVYNSSIGSQDDSDITIIHPSIIPEHDDEYVPIITRLKQANHSSENRQINNDIDKRKDSDGKHDYIFVDHNPQENAQQLEQVLISYVRDLKQESNTQFDCSQQLITRLMDLIRAAYSNDQKKMIELDEVMKEIGSLHDRRFIDQKEKIEQLRTEICQLQKMLMTTPNEQSIYNGENNRNYSMYNTIHRTASMNDQWTEIEDDTKKLHEIVQSQRSQINEIVSLISQSATTTNSLDLNNTSINNSEGTLNNKQTASASNSNNVISTLLKKIHDITGHRQDSVIDDAPQTTTTLENHSPGASPSESMATLILQSLEIKADNQKQDIEEPVDRPMAKEEPHSPIDIPLTPVTADNGPKKCPVCSHEFTPISDDVDVYDHIEKCLFPTGINAEPKDYECPVCNRKFPGNDESVYHQHLSDCYNRDF